MTDISYAGRELAAKLANADEGDELWTPEDAEEGSVYSAFCTLARLATDHLALKAEHEKAVADLREIAALLANAPDSPSIIADAKAIAATYRETDPLVEAFQTCWPGDIFPEGSAAMLRAELSKRGFELARVQP